MERDFSADGVLARGEERVFAPDDGVGAIAVGHFDTVKTVRFVDFDNSAGGLDRGTFRHWVVSQMI
jgi:hypothetical protein